jgi:hypothetical protein
MPEQTRTAILQRGDCRIGQSLGAECMVRRAADIGAARNGHHVVKGRNAAAGACQRGSFFGMRMNDGAHITPGLVDIAMKAPFARRPPPTEATSAQIHERNVVDDQRLVGHAGGTHKKSLRIAAHTDVSGSAVA